MLMLKMGYLEILREMQWELANTGDKSNMFSEAPTFVWFVTHSYKEQKKEIER